MQGQWSQSCCQIAGGKEEGLFLTQLGMGFGMSQSLCWPASGQGQAPGPDSPRTWSGLLMGWMHLQPVGMWFSFFFFWRLKLF